MAVHVMLEGKDRPRMVDMFFIRSFVAGKTVKQVKVEGDRLVIAFTNGWTLKVHSPGVAYVELAVNPTR